MITIAFSPSWFYGFDIFIDIISIIVLCLIGFFSFKFFMIDKKNNNYLWLSISFLMIAAAFFFKIFTNFTIYYDVPKTVEIGLMNVTFNTIQKMDLMFTIGNYLFRLLTLFGLLILLNVTNKQKAASNIIIGILFILIMYFAQNAYHIFHIMSFLILLFISLNYTKKYQESKKKTTLLLTYGFSIITISHIVFYLMIYGKIFYAVAEIIQLFGYILLLITFFLILYYSKIDTLVLKRIFKTKGFGKDGTKKNKN